MTPRILVVEDDKLVVENLAQLLTEFGYEFLGAVSEPGDAVERARLLHPDLILMDIFFEGVPLGLDVAQHVNDETGARIVFVGKATDPSLFLRLVHADALGCVDKPIDSTYLRAVIERALRGPGMSVLAASGD